MRTRVSRFLALMLLIGFGAALTTSAEHSGAVVPGPSEQIIDFYLTLVDWSDIGDQQGADFGYSVATAGDVNNDGYADIIVGAPLYGVENEGAAFIYYGRPSGLDDGPNLVIAGENKGSRFGHSVGTAGDVNNDGYDDVIVGAYRHNEFQREAGRVYIFYGSSGGLISSPGWTFDGERDAHFGISVGTAGNVNNDDYDDIIVGAERYVSSQENVGAAFVFYGSETGPITTTNSYWVVESDQSEALFGASVGTAGDVNGDDYDDVIVGAPQYDYDEVGEGAAFVFLGSDSGLSTSYDWMAEGDQAGAEFGTSVGTAGDVNGDGFGDVIIGAPMYDGAQPDVGGAFAFYGSDSGLGSAYNWAFESDQQGSGFGTLVGTAGNVNGGDYDDIIVGAPRHQVEGQQAEKGGAFIFRGSFLGLRRIPDWSADGVKQGAEFGVSVGTAGDINNDGYADVIVGAPKYMWDDKTVLGWVLVHFGTQADDTLFFNYLPLVLRASP